MLGFDSWMVAIADTLGQDKGSYGKCDGSLMWVKDWR